MFKSLVCLLETPKKSRRKRDSNPGPSALEADALTTRPTRRSPAVDGQSLDEDEDEELINLSCLCLCS